MGVTVFMAQNRPSGWAMTRSRNNCKIEKASAEYSNTGNLGFMCLGLGAYFKLGRCAFLNFPKNFERKS